MDDEKPLDLRDKMALEILNGLLAGDTNAGRGSSGTTYKGLSVEIRKFYLSSDPENKERAKVYAEDLVRTAYMMADVMRKVRLDPFS